MAEIERVAIHHPKIDDGERIHMVPAASIDHYVRAGWQLYEPPPEQGDPPQSVQVADQTPEAPAESGASSLEEAPRRRRAQKDGE
jgi:hypothetical protein